MSFSTKVPTASLYGSQACSVFGFGTEGQAGVEIILGDPFFENINHIPGPSKLFSDGFYVFKSLLKAPVGRSWYILL